MQLKIMRNNGSGAKPIVAEALIVPESKS